MTIRQYCMMLVLKVDTNTLILIQNMTWCLVGYANTFITLIIHWIVDYNIDTI